MKSKKGYKKEVRKERYNLVSYRVYGREHR